MYLVMTTPASPYNSYLETQILSADPMQLVEILYRAAIDSLESARLHLHACDVASRARSITKAIEILNELAFSLNLESGGEIARNLSELYDYSVRRLLTANSEQIDAPLAEVKILIGTLLDAWQTSMVSHHTPVYTEVPLGDSAVASTTLCATF